MAKVINEPKVKSKESINRADYEYLRDETFSNVALIVSAISIYSTLAYAVVSFLKSKTQKE